MKLNSEGNLGFFSFFTRGITFPLVDRDYRITPPNTEKNGWWENPPFFSVGDTPSSGWFSSVMLSFQGGMNAYNKPLFMDHYLTTCISCGCSSTIEF